MTAAIEESAFTSAAACGIAPLGSRAAELLARLRAGPEGEPHGDAILRIAAAPTYVPYRSTRIGRAPAGERMCRAALALAASPELRASVAASPPGRTTRASIRFLHASLWCDGASPEAEALRLLCSLAPSKGGEARELVDAYLRRGADPSGSVAAMVLRDFWAHFHCVLAMRCRDPREPDLSASLMAFCMAADYRGAADDAGVDGVDGYVQASGEGIGCLAGVAAQQALRDITVTTAFIGMKDDALRALGPGAPRGRHRAAAPTPADYLVARWWDGGLPAVIRLIVSWEPYRHLASERGHFVASDGCPAIHRCLSSLLRYNDIVDLLPDAACREPFNELLLALASGGGQRVIGFADALAAATDGVLACRCGRDGHEVAAEIAMAMCLSFAVAPRYRLRARLAALARADDHGHFEAAPHDAARATAATTLSSGILMYSPAWRSLWRRAPRAPDGPWAHELARRAVRRYFASDRSRTFSGRRCVALTRELVERATAPGDTSPEQLASGWMDLFDVVATTAVPQRGCEHELRDVVGRVWTHVVLGSRAPAPAVSDARDVRVFMDIDRALRGTFAEPPEAGTRLRRALLGVLTTALELAGHNPYGRLVDGVGRFCATRAGTRRGICSGSR